MRTTRRVLGKVLRSGEALALVPIGLQFMLPDPLVTTWCYTLKTNPPVPSSLDGLPAPKSAGAITPRWVTCTIKGLLYWAGTQGGGISTTF